MACHYLLCVIVAFLSLIPCDVTMTLINKLYLYTGSFAVIYMCLLFGDLIKQQFALFLPSSVIGLLLLWVLLINGVLSSDNINLGANILLKYMALMFLPASVGLIDYYDVLADNLAVIVLSTVISSIVMLVTISMAIDKVIKSRGM